MPGAEPFYYEGNDIGCVVCHGFTGTPQSVREWGETLAREGGLTVIGPRLPGHGTRPDDMALVTAEDWIREMEHALHTLRRRCRRVYCAGLSMGGTLSLYVAGAHPDAVAGIVTVNAATFLDKPDLAALAFAENPPPAGYVGAGADFKKPGVIEVCYPTMPMPPIRHLYALVAVTRDLLPRVLCPALVFQSREDFSVPPENGPYILQHISARDRQLVWLDNSYHVATIDNDKELIAEQTLQFIHSHA
jgi:carboxylesterase